MGQAKRRTQKKTEFTWPRVTFDKASLLAMREKLKTRLAPVTEKWQQLPRFHRRALMVLAPLLAILLMLPSRAPIPAENSDPVRRELSLQLNEPQPEQVVVGDRAEPASPKREVVEQRLRPLNPPPAAQTKPVPAKPVAASGQATQNASASAPSSSQPWVQYKVKSGETLAMIFRERSLPLADLYALAAIEGKDKPLSQVQAGQLLRYRQTAGGGLDALQIEGRSGEPVMFFRRSDGSFVRSQ